MPLSKPPDVAADEFKSAKWNELTSGRSFRRSDAPALSLLCQWHKIAQTAMEELDGFGGQTAYQNDAGDLKAFPQIQTLKTASGEIRRLMAQLGIDGDAEKEAPSDDNILSIVSGRRTERRARAAG